MPLKPHEQEEQYTMVMNFMGRVSDVVWPLADGAKGALRQVDNTRITNGYISKLGGYQAWGPTVAGGTQTCYGVWNFNRHDADGVITRQLVAVFDDTVYLYNSGGGGSWDSQGTLTEGGRECTAAQAGNRLFISNGACDPVVWDGSTLQDVNVNKPVVTVTGWTTSGGHLHNPFTYKVRVTWYSSTTGDESLPSDQLDIGVPAGANYIRDLQTTGDATVPARFDSIRVYRTTGDGETELYDNIKSSIDPTVNQACQAGLVADENLGDEAPFDNDPMPSYQVIWFWDGRLFGCYDPNNPTELGWSKLTGEGPEPAAWPLVDNRLELDKNDGHPLTGMRDLGGRLYVFKDNAVYLISPVGGAYGQKRLPTPTGLNCHWLCIEADNALWGVGRNALWRFDGGGFSVVSKPRYSLIMGAFNQVNMETPAFAIHWRVANENAMVLAMPSSISSVGSAHIDLESAAMSQAPIITKKMWLCEKLDGSGDPWALGDAGSTGSLIEYFRDYTTNAELYEASSAEYKMDVWTHPIDPAPGVLTKMFLRLDLLLAIPASTNDETIRIRIYYDDQYVTEDDIDVTGPFDNTTGHATKVFSEPLDGKHARAIGVRLVNDGDVPGTYRGGYGLIGIGILWKPADTQVQL